MRVTAASMMGACDHPSCGRVRLLTSLQEVRVNDRGHSRDTHYCDHHHRPWDSITLSGGSPPYPRYYIRPTLGVMTHEIKALRGIEESVAYASR